MCTSPLKAYRTADGAVVFNPHRQDTVQDLELPCGQCWECRFKRSRDWAVRCMHEAQLHKSNAFITLTYAPEHLPADNSLHYDDFQRFMKRLRKRFKGTNIRFYMCGEYGENFGRPHFHACLFGIDFPDKKFLTKNKNGDCLYTSNILQDLWPFGISSIGDVNFQSAAYVARYIMKKITGDRAFKHYNEVDEDGVINGSRTPEFTRMSLKPGIGAGWLEKYRSDVYPHDHVIVKGRPVKPPRYYDKKYADVDPFDFDEIQYKCFLRAREGSAAQSPESRAARDAHHEAKLKLLKRTLV